MSTIPFNPGQRVRVVRYDKSIEDATDYTGREGVYEGLWRDGAGEEHADVTYPCRVLLDGKADECIFKPDELEPCHSEEC